MPLGTFLIAGSAPWTANRRVREKKDKKTQLRKKGGETRESIP